MTYRERRAAALAVALAVALPAAAYLPPASAILRRVSQRRADVGPASMEVRGTLTFSGEAAQRVSAAAGLRSSGPELTVPAILFLKVPGRCRLELAPEGVPASSRPSISAKGSHLAGAHGLEVVPQARAFVDGVCALLGEKGGSGAASDRSIGQVLASHGIALREVTLGRLGTRVAWVIGGRPQEARPQAWVDKQNLQLIRLVAPLAGDQRDVRLLDFGSPVGGDAFPRAVEVWNGRDLETRFTAEKVTRNPRIPDAAF